MNTDEVQTDQEFDTRPAGMTAIGWLYAAVVPVLGAVSFGVATVKWLATPDGSSQNAPLATIVFTTVVAAIVLLLGVISGVGILLNQRWGWGLAVTCLVMSLVRSGFAVAAALQLAMQEGQSLEALAPALFKHAARAGIAMLMLLYLTAEKPRAFYRVQLKHIGMWMGVGLTLIAVNHIAGRLFL